MGSSSAHLGRRSVVGSDLNLITVSSEELSPSTNPPTRGPPQMQSLPRETAAAKPGRKLSNLFRKTQSEKNAERKFSMMQGVKSMGKQLSETILAVDGLASKVKRLKPLDYF